jgi:predicted porin
MKKSIIALAVAGALTAPIVAQADATLYGSLRLKVENADNAELNLADNASRIGIKGSVDTNIDGVKAIYQGEWKVDTADSAAFGAGRLAYVGLTGGFGTAALGSQWTPYYNYAAGATDIMDGNSSAASVETFRANDVIAYVTPTMGGFSGAVAVVADDANGAEADIVNVAAKYSVAGFTLGATQMINNMADDSDATAVALSYEMDALYAALVYQNKETGYGTAATSQNVLAGKELDQYELAGSYSFGDTKVLANYIDMDADASVYGLEVQHKLGKQARVFANYMGVNDEAEAVFGKANTISAGMRVDF